MNKLVWYSSGVLGILSFLSMFYVLFNQAMYAVSTLYYLIILSFVLTLMFLILDPQASKRVINTCLSLLMLLVVLVCMLVFQGMV